MRRVREVLRLRHELGLSNRDIAVSCGVARSTVGQYLRRADQANLSWPVPAELDDAALERLLFPPPVYISPDDRPLPDWAQVHRELKRKGVTLFLLWQEYKQINPRGYQYSQFCLLYRTWASKISVVMRQTHRAGEKTFVDFAGPGVPIVDPATGEISEARIFVAVLGASSYTYCVATPGETTRDWTQGTAGAFGYFGGATELIVPDNPRAAVKDPCFYEPLINQTYAEMARHYGAAVIPARVGRARDKAKVESGVLVVERWILARLRNRTFFSIAELNRAIAELLEELNDRPFKKLPGSRRSLFLELDKPALLPLPGAPYEYAEWRCAKAGIDYHVEVKRHYYSVPYQLVKEKLDVRVTDRTVECFFKGKRVASHVRGASRGGHTTKTEHMPKSHRSYGEWTPERVAGWATKIGPAVTKTVETIMATRVHPQQGFRSALGVIRLEKPYGAERLEAACRRALAIGAPSYKSISSILKSGLDRRALPAGTPEPGLPADHENIRGPRYYQH